MIRLFFGLLLQFASHPAIVIRWSFTLQFRSVVIRFSLHANYSLDWFAHLIIGGYLSCDCYLLATVICLWSFLVTIVDPSCDCDSLLVRP